MKEIKVARYRNIPYIFNYVTNDGTKRYEWLGSKGNKVDIKTLPEDAVQYLLMNSICFKTGDLVIIEDNDAAKEVVENIEDKESYESNKHSREDIIKLLNGSIKTLEKELNKITSSSEKLFIVDIAKEIGLDVSSKRKLLAKMMNTEEDLLFVDESEE